MAKYAKHFAPTVNLITPGAGTAAAGGAAALAAFVAPNESLAELRRKFIKELDRASVPIVVLIDELDRVEDSEIRTVAQLVRAVADFPGISYVLAYDHDRVVQALDVGATTGKETERGLRYLEKNVQLPIPLPATFDEEVMRLITTDLKKLAGELGLPASFDTIDRYQKLLEIVAGGMVATLRDISRLVGAYKALAGMVAGEVDWIDLLAYCVLLIKAPGTINVIRADPSSFVSEILSLRNEMRRQEQQRKSPQERLDSLLPKEENTADLRALIAFLFPTFGGPQDVRSVPKHSNALSTRRPLQIVLRLGLPPGAYPSASIQALVAGSSEEVSEQACRCL
jgi:predicted KAP-like P-loop ATPase